MQVNHIQVCCRIRPAEDGQPPTITSYLNNEAAESSKSRSYEISTPNGSFQMDYAFDSGDSQECIFDRIVQPLLTDAFAGFNCSLFSYGQTGSGKTYTLVGSTGSMTTTTSTSDHRNRGIIPRAAEQIFAKQANLDPQKVMCQVRLSILEVYQEQLKDLLRIAPPTPSANVAVPAKDTPALRIREQIDGTVWVENLTEMVVTDEEDFDRHLQAALKRRVVGAHSMNDVSSRSHFCCIVTIGQVFHGTGVKINSKVHFIDLAGSEMVRKTDATGLRFTEAKHINKSLSALGNVIYALSTGSGYADGNTAGNNNNSSSVGNGAGGGSGGAGTLGAGTGAAGLSKSQQLHRVASTGSVTSIQSASGSGAGGAAAPTAAVAAGGGNGGSGKDGREGGRTHVPYRDSKLTRLLQNSLGGNAKTVIILTVSDAKKHLSETLSTLRFGARARQIQTRAVVNRSVLDDQAALKKNYTKALQENGRLQELVAELQAELHQLRQGGAQHTHPSGGAAGDGHGQRVGDEAVCEICRNFLDLKLRGDGNNTSGGSGSNGAVGVPGRPPARPLPSRDSADAYTGTNAPLSLSTGTVSVSGGASSGADSSDEYSLVEPLERCAICGLSSEESDKLQLYTGEVLGEMFSCDGNCGHQFHVRCVGLIGEGGQYTLPEGEWFCTECYSTYDTQDALLRAPSMDSAAMMAAVAGQGIAVGGQARTSPGGSPGNTNADSANRDSSSTDDLYRSLSSTDLHATAAASLKIAPNRNPSSVLATIKAEYHTMRKERNRILAQWQQEKRIIEKYEVSRRLEQQKRDQELVNAKDTIAQLESIVAQGEAQSARMQKLFDIMLKELQLSTSNMTSMSTVSTAQSTAIRNSVDRLKWASLTVESLLDMPIDVTNADAEQPSPSRYAATANGTNGSQQPSPKARAGSFTRSPKGTLQHSATSPNFSTTYGSSLPFGASAYGSSSSGGDGGGAGIPKPWKTKVRTSGVGGDSTGSSGSNGGAVSPVGQSNGTTRSNGSSSTIAAAGRAALRSESTDSTSAGVAQSSGGSGAFSPRIRDPRTLTNASSADTSGSSARGHNAGNHHSNGTGGGVSPKPSAAATSTSANTTSIPRTTTAPKRDTSPVDSDPPRRRMSDSSDNNSESSRGQSKFINPLKNRLKDLLKSVEAETDAFAEIRQKFKSREDERNQLRNSQTLER